jgi:hypothetical protein
LTLNESLVLGLSKSMKPSLAKKIIEVIPTMTLNERLVLGMGKCLKPSLALKEYQTGQTLLTTLNESSVLGLAKCLKPSVAKSTYYAIEHVVGPRTGKVLK